MKYLIAIALCAVGAFAQLERTEILNIREFVKMTRKTPDDPRNKCVRLKNSNTGYFFTEANDNENKVCLNACQDGRDDCYKVYEGCDSECQLCLRPHECEDLSNRKRCVEIRECKCTVGDFKCLPSNNGVTLTQAPNPDSLEDASYLDLATSSSGLYNLFKTDSCKESGTFQMLQCNPKKEKCMAFEPCTSTDGSCCKLVPGDFMPAGEPSSSTSTSTSSSTSSSSSSSTSTSTSTSTTTSTSTSSSSSSSSAASSVATSAQASTVTIVPP
eukprot:m.19917 g.19917  ORF g.19917 m.19917 type:complete len:271 (-) comp10976_c0_seq1:132-944(-)